MDDGQSCHSSEEREGAEEDRGEGEADESEHDQILFVFLI